jgi:homoserine/homoserine lactone efflux protein
MGFGDKRQSSGPTLTFGLNVTLDGCVDHQERIADDETHAFFTRLMDEGGAILWRRVTYGMVQIYWQAVARGQAEAPPTVREWAAKLEVKPKPVVSSTRTDFPWSRPLCHSHPRVFADSGKRTFAGRGAMAYDALARWCLSELVMSFETWLVYTSVVFVIVLTPGPAAALCMSHGVTHGRTRTLLSIAGLLLSSVTLIGFSTLGVGAVIAASGTFFTVIKLAGAAYLVYLGVSIWRSPAASVTVAVPEPMGSRLKMPAHKLLRTGYLVGVSNPKDLLFFGAFFPQFINPEAAAFEQLLILSATWLVIAGVLMACYAVAGHKLAVPLERVNARGLFNRIIGGILVSMGALLALFRRSDA